jgi:hypothetical protein
MRFQMSLNADSFVTCGLPPRQVGHGNKLEQPRAVRARRHAERPRSATVPFGHEVSL